MVEHYSGWGSTVELAVLDRQRRMKNFYTMPRAGCISRKGIAYCITQQLFPLASYIGNSRIVGYDPHTDNLILRGP
jgi:hypothetical protein